MALNQWMHERNPYKLRPPDFAELAVKHAALRRHCTMLPSRKVCIFAAKCFAFAENLRRR